MHICFSSQLAFVQAAAGISKLRVTAVPGRSSLCELRPLEPLTAPMPSRPVACRDGRLFLKSELTQGLKCPHSQTQQHHFVSAAPP